MELDFDEEKRPANIRKHGIDFLHLVEMFAGPVLELNAPYEAEPRIIAHGAFRGRVVTVIYTWRDGRRRIISAKATRAQERNDYEQWKRDHTH